MKIKVFYNEDTNFWSEYKAADRLTPVWTGEVPECPREELLEWLFRQFNHVDGTELVSTLLSVRSMSVGDVVEVDGERFACASVGWRALNAKEAE